ncbi:ABC transporter ATP-binding protein [Streptococcus porcinus]|uniref:ABC transporter ATP-binding protein n=2 Tax=Streptococcus porcinus TaxID=1340 RepID=A0A4V0H0Y5_STRPO|nr:ABC transporter ATP-binding protein [Streptococcus porcinus]EGJ26762.1 ABC transporter, ATP-binding protein [Streptococcus porcinus str. Jelinkova 176]SQG42449.1 ABC transporter ATP-binding protein [Streptococcus porcinus]VTT41498.1 ABC transporter ATP-binding protein [Streptococcus porcinus]VTT42376.1 ABC transporter ATP-binding protein [Streptococcus porcinus]
MSTLLSLQRIHKIFEAGTVNENHVLRGLSLDVQEGDFISIIGGNGAGKSTLMNSLAGTLKLDHGDILLEGQSISHLSTAKRAQFISRVFQDPKMGTASRLTIEENMAIAHRRGKKRGLSWGVKESDREAYQQALQELGLHLEKRLRVDTQFLSGGQRQALTLLMASLEKPKVLLLDEHTAALDPKTSDMVMTLTDKIVKNHGLTTLMITHNMEHAIQYGNRLVMLHQGQIVVDLKGDDKRKLTVEELMTLFQQNVGQGLKDDGLILG